MDNLQGIYLNEVFLIQPDEAPTHSAMGIEIPEEARERPNSGLIIDGHVSLMAVLPPTFRRVYYPTYVATEIVLNGRVYHIVRQREVLLVTE